MIKHYNFVFLTNTPSFYKINLCNELAKSKSLLLILLGYGEEAVNKKLSSSENYEFDFLFLNESKVNDRNKTRVLIKVFRILQSISYDKILFTGWYIPEYNLISFITAKKKNVLICESTTFEVSFRGIKGWLKKQIIKRMSIVLASGTPHVELFKTIKYNGQVKVTEGVGIINKLKKGSEQRGLSSSLKYIYVGRLIEIKNVRFLVQEFNLNGNDLTIVGQGELEKELKDLAKPNIKFLGFVDNEKLGEVYKGNDIFILPSLIEPWGLVVEEAIYWGLPVIVSDHVGCSIDIVKKYNTGDIFKLGNVDSFRNSIAKIELNYLYYKSNVDKFNFDLRDQRQVKVYSDLI